MKTVLAITLSAGVGIFASLALLSQGHLLQVLALGLALSQAGLAWRYSRTWWLPTSIFGMLGVSHLLANWWLLSHGRPSNIALETFGSGYVFMAAWYFVRKRWFGKAPTTS